MSDQVLFVEQRRPKVFQCNYATDHPAKTFLGVAATGLSQINNRFTGLPIWRIGDQPFHVGVDSDSLQLSAMSQYAVAGIGGTLYLTMNVVPEGAAGTRFVTRFQDSMSWDIPTAENDVDAAMQTIAGFLQSEFPRNGGWRMLQGAWRNAHGFDAPVGMPPNPPGSTVLQEAGPSPDDIYVNPRTGRNFKVEISTADNATVVHTVGDGLADTWTIKYSVENFDGMAAQTFEARNRAWSSQQLSLYVMALRIPSGTTLSMSLGDVEGWRSTEANEALKYTLDVTNKMLQTKFAGASLVPM